MNKINYCEKGLVLIFFIASQNNDLKINKKILNLTALNKNTSVIFFNIVIFYFLFLLKYMKLTK